MPRTAPDQSPSTPHHRIELLRKGSAAVFLLIAAGTIALSFFRVIPYRRSYAYALTGWASLTVGRVFLSSYVSRKVELYQMFLAGIWLSPVLVLCTFVQSVLSGYGVKSIQFLISVGIIAGVPLYMTSRKIAPAHIRILRENAIQGMIFLFTTVLMIGLLEVSLRFLGIEPYHPVKITESYTQPSNIPGLLFQLKPNHRFGIRYPSDPRGYFGPDHTIEIRTNSSGFRDEEFVKEKDPSTFRIALLGDSFGLGYGVRKEDSVADRLERMLSAKTGRTVEVYNFSVMGYSTVEEAILFESTVLDYQPDAVIIWFYLNDPQYRGVMEDIQSDLYKVFPVLRRYSSFFHLVGSRFDNVIPRHRTIEQFRAMYRDNDQRWIDCRRSLEKIGQLASENGISAYLFFHPVLYDLTDHYLFRDIHRKVIETARGFGIKSYDLLDAFIGRDDRSLWVHPQDMHSNEVGNKIAARYVTDILSRQEFQTGR